MGRTVLFAALAGLCLFALNLSGQGFESPVAPHAPPSSIPHPTLTDPSQETPPLPRTEKLQLAKDAEGHVLMDIMPLGDSITQGLGVNRVKRPLNGTDSYRRPLYFRLRERNVMPTYVGSIHENHRGVAPRRDFPAAHEGHWGWFLEKSAPLVGGWVKGARPNIVLMLFGSNDLAANKKWERKDYDLIAFRLAGAAEECFRTLSVRHVVVSAILPRADIPAERLLAANAAIRKKITAMQRYIDGVVSFAPCADGFNSTLHTYDGVHPAPSGEEHLSNCWFDALSPLLP